MSSRPVGRDQVYCVCEAAVIQEFKTSDADVNICVRKKKKPSEKTEEATDRTYRTRKKENSESRCLVEHERENTAA